MNRHILVVMKGTCFIVSCLFFFFLVLGTHNLRADSGQKVLAKVDISGTVEQIPLPVYAHLQSLDGQDYALVMATKNQLIGMGIPYTILDSNAESAGTTSYLIALERLSGARIEAAKTFSVLYDDGRNIIEIGC